MLRKTSMVDFPGLISSVLFFSGCNLRCPWCHNKELITGEESNFVSFEDVFVHLKKRRSVLGAVVLSGGEPCLQNELPNIVREIKKLSLAVKLDTNGVFPAMLEQLFSREETRPDYIALDLKIAPSRYGELSPKEKNAALGDNLVQSAALILKADIAHEYRTLVLPGSFIGEKDIEELALLTDDAPWYFRPFRGGNCLDPAWDGMEEPALKANTRAEALAAKARELGKTTCSPKSRSLPANDYE